MEFTMILMKYGLSIEDITVGAGAVLLVVNLLKGALPSWFEGRWKLLLAAAIGLGYGLIAWQPDWGTAIVGGLLSAAAAVGGWETAKAVAHKVGQPASPR